MNRFGMVSLAVSILWRAGANCSPERLDNGRDRRDGACCDDVGDTRPHRPCDHFDSATTVIYCAITVSALARITAPFLESAYWEVLVVAATAWIVAFAGFALVYGPMLYRKSDSNFPD